MINPQISKTVKGLHLTLVWLIGITLALVPFLFTAQSVFAGMIFAKTMLFWGLATGSVILYCALIYLDREFMPKFSRVGWLFGGLILALALTTATSVQPYTSFWGTLDRTDGLISWLYYLAFFVVVIGTIKTQRDWKLVMNLSALGILLVGISAVYLFIINIGHPLASGRAEGTLGNPVFLGGYLAMASPILLAYALGSKHVPIMRMILKLALIFGYIALLLTFSRGSWLAGIIASALVLIIYFKYFKQPQKLSFRLTPKLIISLGIGIAVLLLGLLSFNQQLDSLWQSKVASSQSLTYRLHIWSISWQSLTEKPLLGWGLENFKIAFDQNFQQPAKVTNLPFGETHANKAHNEYLDMAVMGGTLVLVIYLLLMFNALWVGMKKLFALKDRNNESRFLTIGFIGSLLAYLIFALTAFHLIVNFLWVLLVLAWMNNLSVKSSSPHAPKLLSRVVVSVMAIIAVVGAYFTVVNPVLAVNQASSGTIKFLDGKVDESLTYFKKALGYKSFASNTIRAQMVVLAVNTSKIDDQKLSSNNFRIYLNSAVKDNFLTEPLNSHYHLLFGIYDGKFALLGPSWIKSAEYHFQKCAQLSPNRGEVYLWWAKMYNILGDKIRAEIKLEQALKLAPTNDTVSAFAGFFYMLNGEIVKGTSMFQKTLTLRPNTPPDLIEGLSGLINDLGPAEEIQKIKIFYSKLADEN